MSKSRNVDFNEDDYALYTELTNEELIRNTYAYRAEAKGKEETQLEIAKNLLRKKISKDVIAETTGLSLETLEKLKKEL